MNLKAFGKHIIVEKAKQEVKKGSILLLKEENTNFPAKIFSTGDKTDAKDLVGKNVLVRAFAGNKVDEDDLNTYLLISQEDILGVYECN